MQFGRNSQNKILKYRLALLTGKVWLFGESGGHNSRCTLVRVADHMATLIDKGTLRSGERLPSIRNLSAQMDVNISTVLQAYMILEDKDRIEAKPQSGFYVRPTYNRPEPKPSSPSPVVTRVGVGELVAQVFQSAHDPEMVQLALSTPSPDHLPVKRLNRLMAAATASAGARALSYDFPPGYGPLRHEIAK